MMKTRAREARPSIRTTEALSWGQAAKRHSRKADLRDLGCGEGGANPSALLDRGPQWAFGFKIEKLNTESPRAAVCSPTPRNCDVGMAILNRFESLRAIWIEPVSLPASRPGGECDHIVAEMILWDSPRAFRGWDRRPQTPTRGGGLKSLAPLGAVTASGSPKDSGGGRP
jgi:hypothetical protein